MLKQVRRASLALLGVVALMTVVPTARADTVGFLCGLGGATACSGTVTQSGPNFSTPGINVFNNQGIFGTAGPFSLLLNTATNTIGIAAGTGLSGYYSSFAMITGSTTTSVVFPAFWGTLPAAVQSFLGSSQGVDNTEITFVTATGAVTDVSITITPVPEPGSLTLFGSGLLAISGFLRRKLGSLGLAA